MASTSEIRNGLCIEWNNDIFTVVEFQHVKPGKGAAFVRTKIKSLTNGKVLETNIPSGHKIDIVRVERRKFQYLYPILCLKSQINIIQKYFYSVSTL